MIEQLRGKGTLSREGSYEKHRVSYEGEIETKLVPTRGGFPPRLEVSHSNFSITPDEKLDFPDGRYRLRTDDGEYMRLRRLPGMWRILNVNP